MDKIETAFAEAMDTGAMEPVRAAFLAAQLFVAIRPMPGDIIPSFYTAPSPTPGEMCLTITESLAAMNQLDDVDAIKMTGRDLLAKMPLQMGLVMLHEQGSHYISADNLDWFRSVG